MIKHTKRAVQTPAKIKIVVLVLVLLGAGNLPTPRATAVTYTHGVRFVAYCATDKCRITQSKVNNYATQVRDWYKEKLGRTFNLIPIDSKTPPMRGTHTVSYYGSTGTGSGSDKTTYNTLENIDKDSRIHQADVKTVLILGFESMNHCGATPTNADYALISINYVNCTGYQSSAVAHELGHAFGLGHYCDGTLMNGDCSGASPACAGKTLFDRAGHCKLRASQRSYLLLRRTVWFPVT